LGKPQDPTGFGIQEIALEAIAYKEFWRSRHPSLPVKIKAHLWVSDGGVDLGGGADLSVYVIAPND